MKWGKKSPLNNASKIYYSKMVELKKGKAKSVRKEGQAKKILKENKDLFEVDYHLPFQTHAAMEPLICVVNVKDNS